MPEPYSRQHDRCRCGSRPEGPLGGWRVWIELIGVNRRGAYVFPLQEAIHRIRWQRPACPGKFRRNERLSLSHCRYLAKMAHPPFDCGAAIWRVGPVRHFCTLLPSTGFDKHVRPLLRRSVLAQGKSNDRRARAKVRPRTIDLNCSAHDRRPLAFFPSASTRTRRQCISGLCLLDCHYRQGRDRC